MDAFETNVLMDDAVRLSAVNFWRELKLTIFQFRSEIFPRRYEASLKCSSQNIEFQHQQFSISPADYYFFLHSRPL